MELSSFLTRAGLLVRRHHGGDAQLHPRQQEAEPDVCLPATLQDTSGTARWPADAAWPAPPHYDAAQPQCASARWHRGRSCRDITTINSFSWHGRTRGAHSPGGGFWRRRLRSPYVCGREQVGEAGARHPDAAVGHAVVDVQFPIRPRVDPCRKDDPRHHALTLRGQPRLQDAARAAIHNPAWVAPVKEEGPRACYHTEHAERVGTLDSRRRDPAARGQAGAMATVQPRSFGELLKRYRVAAGLSQEALAERARLSTRAISDLERGVKQTPRRDTVELLAEALQLPREDAAALEAA